MVMMRENIMGKIRDMEMVMKMIITTVNNSKKIIIIYITD